MAEALFLDEETVREWRRAYAADGSASLGLRTYAPRDGHLSGEHKAELATVLRADPPRTTGAVRQLIETRPGKLKEYRGFATRFCRTDTSFTPFIALASTIIRVR